MVESATSGTSASLLRGLQARDESSWQRFDHLYRPLVLAWCRKRGLQATDAEDVAQEVWLAVRTRIAEFNAGVPGGFRRWLWTITNYKLLARHARTARIPLAAGAVDVADERLAETTADVPEPTDEADRLGLLQRACALVQHEFAAQTWKAFWRVMEKEEVGWAEQVARELGLTRNQVYLAKSRILRRLREVRGDVE